MTISATVMVGNTLRAIGEPPHSGVINARAALQLMELAAEAFLTQYTDPCWTGIRDGLFEPIDTASDNLDLQKWRLRTVTVADVKAVVVGNAAYVR